MQELFVYYKVALEHEAAVSAAVARMQAGLCTAHPGLQARLLRRPEATQGQLTLMEVYARPALSTDSDTAGGIDDTLQAAIDQAAQSLSPWLQGGRHTEVFVPCA